MAGLCVLVFFACLFVTLHLFTLFPLRPYSPFPHPKSFLVFIYLCFSFLPCFSIRFTLYIFCFTSCLCLLTSLLPWFFCTVYKCVFIVLSLSICPCYSICAFLILLKLHIKNLFLSVTMPGEPWDPTRTWGCPKCGSISYS